MYYSEEDWKEGVILLLDKPLHWTSFNVVSKVRSLLRHKYGFKKIKVGHAGTLDPLATGLLVICVGKATKQVPKLQGLSKEYVAHIRLGATTPSFDLETEIDQEYPIEHIDKDAVNRVLKFFLGDQMQVPPLFSAKFVDGGRAYNLARKGVQMELDPAPITIHSIELEDMQMPNITVRVNSSKGTYIRALARDIGVALNSGGHLVGLRRTLVGDMDVKNALTIEQFENNLKLM